MKLVVVLVIFKLLFLMNSDNEGDWIDDEIEFWYFRNGDIWDFILDDDDDDFFFDSDDFEDIFSGGDD